jgi:hypothetical protein
MRHLIWGALAVLMTLPAGARAQPSEPPPSTLPHIPAPPPAWVETAGGDHWLDTRYSRWCQETGGGPGGRTCVMVSAAIAPVAQCLVRIPRTEIRIRPGERVRFHLGFVPDALALYVPAGRFSLPVGAPAEWTAQGSSGGAILAPQTPLGNVTYRARFVMGGDAVKVRMTGFRAVREGAGAYAAVEISEPARLFGCLTAGGVRTRGALARGFRAVGMQARAAGLVRVPLGRIPAGRYRLTLMARDADGNSTILERSFLVPAAAPS